MNVTTEQLQQIIEAAIMVAGRPLTISNMQKLFDEGQAPEVNDIKTALKTIQEKFQTHSSIELKEVASGYQFQAKIESSHWLSRLWEERAPRYSRAFLETLALIAYRQPVTRAEIEEIRGVTASSHILKTLQEREWIRVLGYKDIPGKPALYGTTKTFLDYFNLKSLDELPTLAELKDLAAQEAKLQGELDFANEKPEQKTLEFSAMQSETSNENSCDTVEEKAEIADKNNENSFVLSEEETENTSENDESTSGLYEEETESSSENNENSSDLTEEETEITSKNFSTFSKEKTKSTSENNAT